MASLSSESHRRIMRQIRQREAATGRRVAPGYVDSLIRQELEVSASRLAQNRALEIQQEQLDEQSRQFNEKLQLERETAKTAGQVDLASLGVTAGLLLKDTEAGKAVTKAVGEGYDTVKQGVKNVFSPSEPGTAVTETTSPTAATGGVLASQSGSQIGVTGVPEVGESAFGGSTYTFDAASGGITQSGTQAAATSSGTSSGVNAGLSSGLSYGQFATGTVAAASLGRSIIGASGDSTAKDLGTIGTATLYGGAVGGPVGAVVGAVVGVVVDVVSDAVDTIICAELYRQGLLSEEILLKDREYRIKHVDDEVYQGYLILARPIVERMKKSKRFTKIVEPLALAWAHEMASRVDPQIKGSTLGKFINFIGQPLCRLAVKHKELCHG